MKKVLKLFIIFFSFGILLLNSSCTEKGVQIPPHAFSGNAMTINYRILLGQALDEQEKNDINRIIQETFSEIDTIYNKWNPASEVSQLNRMKAGEQKILSLQLYHFLERADYLVALTNGKFDPTVEPLQKLWIDRLEKGMVPESAEIEELRPCIGWDKIHFDNRIFCKDDSRTELDFGGIAKGFCIDLLIDNLTAAGFKNLYIEWGGEIRTTGKHPSGRSWRVFISRLKDINPENAIDTIELSEQAIATSGDYYQYWTVTAPEGDATYCHIFNPQKLKPIIIKPGSVASASLVAKDCLTADALAKVLMLFDTPEEAQAWILELQKVEPTLACWLAVRQ